MNIKKIMRKFPRFNMVIGKKQIIITGLTLILGIAIYVNYVYISGNNFTASENKDSDSQVYYGDAAFVSKDLNNISADSETADVIAEYFAKARLDVRESRDEAKEFLAAMYNGGDVTSEEMEVLARDASSMSDYIESEAKIENLLVAQGFSEVLCYLSDRGANIIVRTNGLDAVGAAKIKNTLLSEVSVAAENITIVEIN